MIIQLNIMKYLYKIVIRSFIAFILLLGGMSSCVDNFGDVEYDLIIGGASADSVPDIETAKGMMLDVMTRIHDSKEHQYQYQFNLHIDNYAGYLCVANNLEGRLPSTNFMNSDFERGPLSSYLMVIKQVVPVINSAEKLEFPEIGAIANIIFCHSSQELADVHGPMPYFDYRKLKQEPPMEYVPVKDIYYDILEQLKNSVEILENANLDDEKKKIINEFDRIAGGNVDTWIKFANTLRLRIALHMKKADPEKARTEAEAAVKAGVLGFNDPDIELLISGKQHPLYIISHTWNDTRLNASFEMILKRLSSPMLSVLFEANNGPVEDKNGELVLRESYEEYVGIRSGTSVFNKLNNLKAYILFSRLNVNFATKRIAILKASESFFLRAEGALYGWDMGGTVKQLYDDGIKLSFYRELGWESKEATLRYNQYMRREVPEDISYIDYYDSNNNFSDTEYMVQVGNKWDDSDTNERKLERIMTQKYIANYPLSLEAWTDIRRTGYPRQIPVVYDAGDYSTRGGIIRRIPYQLDGTVDSQDVYSTGVPALDEEATGDVKGDYQGTRLWWDVDIPNF